MPPTDESVQLRKLLEENLEVAKDNNRLLRKMYRNSILSAILKVVIWLVLLGVPLFFLSTYMGPLLSAFSGGTASKAPSGAFGLPSKDQVQDLLEQYKSLQQGQ